jgi:hypothetical protein
MNRRSTSLTVAGSPPADGHPSSASSGRSLGLRLYVGALVAVVLGSLAASLLTGSHIDLPVLLAFAAAALAAKAQEVLFPDHTGISAQFVVIAAAVVATPSAALVPTVLLVGMAGDLYRKHLRQGEWIKLAYNSSSMAVVALSAVGVFSSLPDPLRREFPGVLAAGVIAAAVAWTVNVALLGCVLELAEGRVVRKAWMKSLRSDLAVFPCALVGVGAGYLWRDETWWLGLVVLWLAIALVPMTVVTRRRYSRWRRAAALASPSLPPSPSPIVQDISPEGQSSPAFSGWSLALRLYVGALAVGTLGSLAASLLSGSHIDLPVLLAFGAVAIAATAREVLFPDHTGISAQFVVMVAAVVATPTAAVVPTALLVAMAGDLYTKHLRHGEWIKLIYNSSSMGLMALSEAAVFSSLPDSLRREFPGVLVGGAIAAAVGWAVNTALLGCVLGLAEGRAARNAWWKSRSDLAVFPCALAGVGAGFLWREEMRWLGLVVLCLAIALVPMTLIARGRYSRWRRAVALASRGLRSTPSDVLQDVSPERQASPAFSGWGLALRLYVGALVVGTLGSLAAFLLTGSHVDVPIVLAFGGVASAVKAREVLFPDHTALTAAIVVIWAVVVAAPSEAVFPTALLVGMVSEFDLPFVRQREWMKLAYNSSSMALVALSAAGVFSILPHSLTREFPGVLMGGLIAGMVDWVVNCTLLSFVLGLVAGGWERKTWIGLIRSDLAVLLCALVGLGAGYLWAHATWWLGFLLLCVAVAMVPAILSVRDRFASWRQRRRVVREVVARITELEREVPEVHRGVVSETTRHALSASRSVEPTANSPQR